MLVSTLCLLHGSTTYLRKPRLHMTKSCLFLALARIQQQLIILSALAYTPEARVAPAAELSQ